MSLGPKHDEALVNLNISAVQKNTTLYTETQEEKKQKTLTHLSTIDKYNSYSEAEKEEIRNRQRNYVSDNYVLRNQSLINQVYAGVPTNIANTCAKSFFKKMEPPAQETFKQKQERTRQQLRAKLSNVHADHYSYGIKQNLQEREDTLNNSIQTVYKQLSKKLKGEAANNLETLKNSKTINMETLKCFCRGYKRLPKTDPNYQYQAGYLASDGDFFIDYVTDKKNSLADITNSLLTMEPSIDMFRYNHLKQHAGDVKSLCAQYTTFKLLYEAPENAEYFNSLSDNMKKLIKIRILDLIEPLNNALNIALKYKSIDLATNDYISRRTGSVTSETLHTELQNLVNVLKTKDKNTQEHFHYELKDEKVEGVKKEEVPGYEKVENCKKLMYENPSEYSKNMEIIDKLYNDLLVNVDAITHLTYLTKKSYEHKNSFTYTHGIEYGILSNTADKIKDINDFKIHLQKQDMNANINVIEHLLNKTALTPEGKLLLNSLQVKK